jgi:hypothetical protein
MMRAAAGRQERIGRRLGTGVSDAQAIPFSDSSYDGLAGHIQIDWVAVHALE